MIRRLELENFYSIRETQVIDLGVTAKVTSDLERYYAPRDGSEERIPKVVALFGANASGKSNVLKALTFLRWFLEGSVQAKPDANLEYVPFADKASAASVTRIKVHFDWFQNLSDLNLHKSEGDPFAQYSYEVRLRNENAGGGTVLSEELRFVPPVGRSRRLFERDENGAVKADAEFSMKGYSQILAKLRKNASLSSTLGQFVAESPVTVFLAWAKRIPSNLHGQKFDFREQTLVDYYALNPRILANLNEIVQKVDLGLNSVTLARLPNGEQGVLFAHQGLDFPIIFQAQSEGTKQFVRIFPFIQEALIMGGIAVIDELDSTIHPILLPEILRWFYDEKTNPHNAQLWISGQSASLLEELRKEEVFFTEKDAQGRTNVYGLKEIEGVRRVDNFYQKYMGGVYGAIPRIG